MKCVSPRLIVAHVGGNYVINVPVFKVKLPKCTGGRQLSDDTDGLCLQITVKIVNSVNYTIKKKRWRQAVPVPGRVEWCFEVDGWWLVLNSGDFL